MENCERSHREMLRDCLRFCFRTSYATAALLLAVVLVSAELRADPPPTNVLFVTVDDMNCDSVGAFGCQVDDITPHIDRLAAQGLRFERAHVTIAICQPTRAVWMTGRYPHRSGAFGFDPIRPEVPTLVEALKDAGYYTGILAKEKHVVPTRKNAWDMIVSGTELKMGRDPGAYYEHCLRFFMQAKQADSPFFLMANSQDPHRPFAGSQAEHRRRKKSNAGQGFPNASRIYRPDEVSVPKFLPDIPDVREEIAQYFTSVHRADEIVGSVLRALEESGLAESTLVMFCSDHGMPLPFAKTNCWYHSTRTPWIVRWPGVITPGKVDDEHFVSGIDFAPTILDALDLSPLPEVSGRSFEPLLRNGTQEGRDHVFTQIHRTAGRREFPMRSVQNSRFGYIFNAWADGETRFRNESQGGLTMKAMIRAAEEDPRIAARVQHFLFRCPEEFYDYEQDPNALHNLIDDPKYQVQVSKMRKLLSKEMRESQDPLHDVFDRLPSRKDPK